MNSPLRWLANHNLIKTCSSYGSSLGAPIILIGMHRSGTSMTTRLLRQAGGYFGHCLDHNSEAFTFIRINDLILNQVDARWNIIPDRLQTDLLGKNNTIKTVIAQNLPLLNEEFFSKFGENGIEHKGTTGKPALTTLSLKNAFTQPVITHSENTQHWGWKDPRNTITLGVWLALFPNAKVIHVIRNGIDVAFSLWRRAHKYGDGAPECLDLLYCFSLWEKYTEIGLSWKNVLDNQYSEFKYEELLTSPKKILSDLEGFLAWPELASIKLESLDKNRIGHDEWSNHPELLEAASQSGLFNTLYPNYVEMLKT